MKKIVVVLTVLLAVIVTGCSEKEPQPALKEAYSNTKEIVENEKVDSRIDIDGSVESMGIKNAGQLTIESKTSPEKKNIKALLDASGISYNIEVYQDGSTMYMKAPMLQEYLEMKVPEETEKETAFNSNIGNEVVAQIDEDSFSSTKETITINKNKTEARKITIDINDSEAKDIIRTFTDELFTQGVFKDIAVDLMKTENPGISEGEIENELNKSTSEFKNNIDEILNEIEIDKVNYTAYISDDIVKKEEVNLKVSSIPADEKFELNIESTILATGSKVSIDMPDITSDETITIDELQQNQRQYHDLPRL